MSWYTRKRAEAALERNPHDAGAKSLLLHASGGSYYERQRRLREHEEKHK